MAMSVYRRVIFVCVICLDCSSPCRIAKTPNRFFKMSGILNSHAIYFLRDTLSSAGRGSFGTHSKPVFGDWPIFDANTSFCPFFILVCCLLLTVFLSPF